MKLFIVNVICTYHITITVYLQHFRSRIGIKQSLKHIEREKCKKEHYSAKKQDKKVVTDLKFQ